MRPRDPRALARRPRRPVRLGQVDVRAKHFLPTEVLSSDVCRGLVSDDENDQAATNDAFEVLHFIAAQAAGARAADGHRRHQRASRRPRKPLVALAREYHCLPVAIVLRPARSGSARSATGRGRTATSARTSIRNQTRAAAAVAARPRARGLPPRVRPRARPRRSRRRRSSASRSGTTAGASTARSTSSATSTAAATSSSSCSRELGYERRRETATAPVYAPPGRAQGGLRRRPGRPRPAHRRTCCGWSMDMVDAGTALCVPGNHDMKLLRKLRGRDVQITHGLAESLAELEHADDARVPRARSPTSSTASSATTCSTTASWSSPTPG